MTGRIFESRGCKSFTTSDRRRRLPDCLALQLKDAMPALDVRVVSAPPYGPIAAHKVANDVEITGAYLATLRCASTSTRSRA